MMRKAVQTAFFHAVKIATRKQAFCRNTDLKAS